MDARQQGNRGITARGWRRTGRLLSFALWFGAATVVAQPTAPEDAVVLRAYAEPTEIRIGDPIRYTVEASAADDVEIIVPVLADAVGGFTITDFGESPPRREDGRLVVSRWYTLITFVPGDQFIPAPTVAYRTAGEELREAEGNEVLISVASMFLICRARVSSTSGRIVSPSAP